MKRQINVGMYNYNPKGGTLYNNMITTTTITETLLNNPITHAEPYYKSDFDRLTKQIYYNGEYYQLIVSDGIIAKVINMKDR